MSGVCRRVKAGFSRLRDVVDGHRLHLPDYLYALAHGLQPPRTLDDAEANELEVTLAELRRLVGKTQVDVAASLGIGQGDVSRLERRGDARLSTLRRYVEALGGELEIVARIGSDQGMLLDRPASNKLYAIDVDAAEVVGAATVGQGAHGVVVDEAGAFAYVTNQAEDTVSVVDLSSMTEIDRVDVGAKPNGIGHWHVTGGMP